MIPICVYLGGKDRHYGSESVLPRTQHIVLARLKPGILHPILNALTMRPPCLCNPFYVSIEVVDLVIILIKNLTFILDIIFFKKGQVLLDKNSPQIKTVVNKTNTIHDVFRFFKMEVIAGENNLYTSVKQDGCIFEFDFSKVYWNSRLQTEHSRLVEFFDSDDVVCDMFAGVGPFAIPAAKKGCTVYGNDLNPASYEALLKNAKLNHVEDKIHAFNMDGRDFVRKIVQLSLPLSSSSSTTEQSSKSLRPFTHVVMNLPASAVEFVDVFQGLYSKRRHALLPMIHCYCFSKSESPGDDAKEQVEKKLGRRLTSQFYIHCVRDVAPKKVMVCVSFKLPESIAFADVSEICKDDSKRQRDDSGKL